MVLCFFSQGGKRVVNCTQSKRLHYCRWCSIRYSPVFQNTLALCHRSSPPRKIYSDCGGTTRTGTGVDGKASLKKHCNILQRCWNVFKSRNEAMRIPCKLALVPANAGVEAFNSQVPPSWGQGEASHICVYVMETLTTSSVPAELYDCVLGAKGKLSLFLAATTSATCTGICWGSLAPNVWCANGIEEHWAEG